MTAYLSLESWSAKNTVISAVAEKNLSIQELEIYKSLRKNVQSCEKKRNKLAHWSWGYTPDIPEAFILAQPRYLVMGNDDLSNVYVYKQNDFESIIEENVKTTINLGKFTQILKSRPYKSGDTELHLLSGGL